MINNQLPELNYIRAFKGTPMYNATINLPAMKWEGKKKSIDPDNLMSMNLREEMKRVGDDLGLAGFQEACQLMRDLSHFFSFICNPMNPGYDFFEYITRKYTNPDCLTYEFDDYSDC